MFRTNLCIVTCQDAVDIIAWALIAYATSQHFFSLKIFKIVCSCLILYANLANLDFLSISLAHNDLLIDEGKGLKKCVFKGKGTICVNKNKEPLQFAKSANHLNVNYKIRCWWNKMKINTKATVECYRLGDTLYHDTIIQDSVVGKIRPSFGKIRP